MNADTGITRQLEEDFPGWRFWRSIDGLGRPQSWMATRLQRGAGVEPTLMAPNVPALRVLLAEQRDRAARRVSAPILAGPTF